MQNKRLKPRDYNILAIIKKEAQGRSRVVPSKRHYTRKLKHKDSSLHL